MAWYKISQLDNFEDRNIINDKIREITALSELLRYAGKLIYQTARGARALVMQISKSKTLSSYPPILEILEQADKIAIDNPVKFKECCHAASENLGKLVVDLERERSEFTKDTLSNRLKGWIIDE